MYGPYTLDAYISKFRQMAMDMATVSQSLPTGYHKYNSVKAARLKTSFCQWYMYVFG